MALTATITGEIREALAATPHGGRTALLERFAARLGLNRATLYRHLRQAGIVRGAAKTGRAPTRPEYLEWATVARTLALKVPKDAPPTPLWMAVRQAVADGLVPPEAAAVPLATFYRVLRAAGYHDQERRTRTLWHERPMGVVQFDASTSEHFSVVDSLEDGDYLLRLNTLPYTAYKNKPLTKLRLRVMVYALWDMNTGYTLSRYLAMPGENSLDSIDFLLWAFGEEDKDPRIPFCGAPESLWVDQGPLAKAHATRELLDNLGINVQLGTPYEKTARGGVEQTHKQRWRFERHFYMRLEEGRRFEITLSDLNAALTDYLVEINGRPARIQQRHLSRCDAWIQGVNRMGGVTRIPPEALTTLAISHRRVVRAGIVRFGTQDYEVEGLSGGEVYVKCDVDGVPRTAESLLTGARHPLTLRTPVLVGEGFQGIKDLPVEKLKKESRHLTATTPIFGAGGAPAGNVVSFPVRKNPARPLDNPLDASRYQSVDEAMAAFNLLLIDPLPPHLLDQVRELVTENALDRAFVRELALATVHAAQSPERIAR